MKGGHFFPEETPTETTKILNEFPIGLMSEGE